MILIIAYAVALTAVGWTQWLRRGTWRIPWESPTTAASLQLGVALVLIAPASQPVIGRLLWEVTGRWHVNDVLGHIIEAAALGASTLAGMMRMPSMRQRIVPLLQWPFTLAVTLMVAFFIESRVSRHLSHDLFRIPNYHWLAAYFTVLWALLLYYGALNAWVAMELRHDPRSRPVAARGCLDSDSVSAPWSAGCGPVWALTRRRAGRPARPRALRARRRRPGRAGPVRRRGAVGPRGLRGGRPSRRMTSAEAVDRMVAQPLDS